MKQKFLISTWNYKIYIIFRELFSRIIYKYQFQMCKMLLDSDQMKQIFPINIELK